MQTEEQTPTPAPVTTVAEFKCEVCGNEYESRNSLTAHRRGVHGIRIRPARGQTQSREDRIRYQKEYRAKRKAEMMGIKHNPQPVVREKKPQPQQDKVKFCPSCGCNIAAVDMVLKMTK